MTPRFMAGTLSRECLQATPTGDHGQPRMARATDSRSSRAVTANGTAPSPTTSVSTPSAAHAVGLLPHLLGRPHQTPLSPLFERHAVEHARGRHVPEPLEASLEVAFVVAAEGVEAERSGDRPGVTADRVARPRQDLEALAVAVGRPHPTGVPPVGDLRHQREQAVALPAHEDRRARPLHRRRLVLRAGCAVEATVERARAAAEQPVEHLHRFAQAGRAAPPDAAWSCRSPRTRARTTPRRRPRRADRRTPRRGWRAIWRGPPRAGAPRTSRGCRGGRA